MLFNSILQPTFQVLLGSAKASKIKNVSATNKLLMSKDRSQLLRHSKWLLTSKSLWSSKGRFILIVEILLKMLSGLEPFSWWRNLTDTDGFKADTTANLYLFRASWNQGIILCSFFLTGRPKTVGNWLFFSIQEFQHCRFKVTMIQVLRASLRRVVATTCSVSGQWFRSTSGYAPMRWWIWRPGSW